jgi:hypothetical protein
VDGSGIGELAAIAVSVLSVKLGLSAVNAALLMLLKITVPESREAFLRNLIVDGPEIEEAAYEYPITLPALEPII